MLTCVIAHIQVQNCLSSVCFFVWILLILLIFSGWTLCWWHWLMSMLLGWSSCWILVWIIALYAKWCKLNALPVEGQKYRQLQYKLHIFNILLLFLFWCKFGIRINFVFVFFMDYFHACHHHWTILVYYRWDRVSSWILLSIDGR